MPLIFDGRNWFELDYLISAVPARTSGLVVTMLRGDPVTLSGPQAEVLRAQLMAASLPPPPPPAVDGTVGEVTYARRVKLTHPADPSSIVGPPQDQ